MIKTNWHILMVNKNTILKTHTEFQGLISSSIAGRKIPLAGCELWNPFRMVKVKNPDGGRVKHRAVSKFDHLFFIKLASRDQRIVIDDIVKQRKHIRGAFLSPAHSVGGPDWYHMPEREMERLKDYHGASFDAKRDARFNKDKLYGQKELEIPVYTKGDLVEYFSGAYEGIKFEVLSTLDDMVRMEPVEKSYISKVEANVFDLKRAG